MKEVYLSKEGLEKLKEELKNLKNVVRKEIVERIKEAKSYGDLSENSEYEAAKNEQAFIEGRILELETIIKNARVVAKSNGDKVMIGSQVQVKNDDNETDTFVLVDKTEAAPDQGKLSYDSPLGSALLGKTKGDEVEVKAPSGNLKYKIVEIR
ncbi:MAG: transcription elongation factor GreA [Candidatus Berkelbacteria bacterium]|nr:transcription elongation factor GreA [Candidatus Berkelbacteria bacterium]